MALVSDNVEGRFNVAVRSEDSGVISIGLPYDCGQTSAFQFSHLYIGYKKTPHLVSGHEKYMSYSRKIP